MPVFAIDRRIRLPLVCVAALIAGCSGGEARKAKHMEKGQTFLAAGNLDKARIHGEANSAVTVLQTASSMAPNLPILWYHLGMAQMLSGETEAARASLARSLQSGQNFPGIDEAKATLSKLAVRSNG